VSVEEDSKRFTLTNRNFKAKFNDKRRIYCWVKPPESRGAREVRQTPVIFDGELRVGTRLKATLSVDHRVSDGVEGARFMQALAKYLEQPVRLLVG